MIYGIVKAQKLDLRAAAAADTIDYLTAKFSFMSADWDGLVKYAHFQQGNTRYSVQLTDDKITESDHLNLGAGEWQVYLHGNEYKNGEVIKRVTTNIATFTVEPTGVLNGEPFPEVEASVVEQIEAEITDHEERITELEQSAGSGNVDDVVDTDGNSLVENKIATIPTGKRLEIVESVIQGTVTSKYTRSEVFDLFMGGVALSCQGQPILDVVRGDNYYLYFFGGGYNDEPYFLRREIRENKTIDSNFTNAGYYFKGSERQKLQQIANGAQVNVIEKIKDSNGTELPITNKAVTLPAPPSVPVTDVQDPDGNSLVDNGVATIPDEVVEIIKSYRLAYTPAELYSMYYTKVLKLDSNLVVGLANDTPQVLKVYYLRPENATGHRMTLYYNEYDSSSGNTISTLNEAGVWSEESFHTFQRQKLNLIEAEAQVNKIETIKKSDGTALTITSKSVTLPEIPVAPTDAEMIEVCSIIADFITDGTNIIGVDSTTALAF